MYINKIYANFKINFLEPILTKNRPMECSEWKNFELNRASIEDGQTLQSMICWGLKEENTAN